MKLMFKKINWIYVFIFISSFFLAECKIKKGYVKTDSGLNTKEQQKWVKKAQKRNKLR